MIYDSYNENSSLFPNQAVQGRDPALYAGKEPEMPRRYHRKLREGDEHSNLKRIYPESKFADFWEKRKKEKGEDTKDEPAKDPEGGGTKDPETPEVTNPGSEDGETPGSDTGKE